MLLSWAPPADAALVREFARWLAALTPAACAYLRRKDCFWRHVEEVLQPGELAWLRGCDNPPVKVLMVLSGLLARWATRAPSTLRPLRVWAGRQLWRRLERPRALGRRPPRPCHLAMPAGESGWTHRRWLRPRRVLPLPPQGWPGQHAAQRH